MFVSQIVPSVLSAIQNIIQCLPQQESTHKKFVQASLVDEQELMLLNLIGGLTVIQEIVFNLSEFVSPYIRRILAIVMDPKVLSNRMQCLLVAIDSPSAKPPGPSANETTPFCK